MVVGLLADPDLPVEIARRIAEDLPDVLAERITDQVSWEVETVCDPFEAGAPDYDRLLDKARQRVSGVGWDIAICITDVPIRTANGAVVADVSIRDHVALLSLPAMGGFRLTRHTRDVIVALVDELAGGLIAVDRADAPTDERPSATAGLARRAAPVDKDVDTELVRSWGALRLLAGLVRANRPWHLTVGLSTALAGAATGSLFGILYSTIWTLGAQLDWWRFVAVTGGAVTVFVVWLIAGHGLWERRSAPVYRLINASTVVTVVTGVLLFFGALLLINLTAAVVVIPPDFFATQLGRPIGPFDYLRVALMATAMGLVAGAVGSGLEDDSTVRQAAYSQREQRRRSQMAQ